jgi:hypothetical protein
MYWQTLINKENGRFAQGAQMVNRHLWNGLNAAMASHSVSNHDQLKLIRNAPGYQRPVMEIEEKSS